MYQGKFERKKAKISAFYTVLSLAILLLCAASFLGLGELNRWLTRYEMAQPSAQSAQIFASLFASPD